MKKALIFDPYLDTLGGGERYALSFAIGLQKEGYQVEIAWPEKDILTRAQDRFGLNLDFIKTNNYAYNLFTKHSSLLKKLLLSFRYRLIFWVSDGSLPLLISRNNLVHFQVPFSTIGGSYILNKIKTIFITKFVYNSRFTASIHEKHLPSKKSFILYPPIDTTNITMGKKEDLILSVARFDSPSHPKRQDVLIDAFKILSQKYPQYKLFLAGGSQGNSDILKKLKLQANDLPVKFIINPNFNKLKQLYSKAKFFWHATGFGIDESVNPEKVEHFGMTTVEAMSSGCIPIVIGKGGQKEIVSKETGSLCQTSTEIADKTASLIAQKDVIDLLSANSIRKASDYSIQIFYQRLRSLL